MEGGRGWGWEGVDAGEVNLERQGQAMRERSSLSTQPPNYQPKPSAKLGGLVFWRTNVCVSQV